MKKAFSEILKTEVLAEEVSENESLKNGLRCRDCGIPVSHRREHKRNESLISAHFVRRQEHNESCQYHAEGQMKVLARLSDDDVLSSLDKKNFIFRLTMIHDELDGKKEKEKDKAPQGTKVSPTNKEYEGKGRLSSYLGTMKKIIELRNILADDKRDLTSIVEINFRGKKIKWDNFYYEPERYLEAYKYVKNQKREDRHPICIEGIVQTIQPMSAIDNYAINLRWGKQSTNSKGVLQIPSPSIIYVTKKQLSELGVKPGQRIAVCTLFSYALSASKVREFLNVKGIFKHKHQLVILD
ncbi:hypothetical protein COJ00_27065 [Priestia megaterium]|uniref:hypothetical protein n=1 Tax=Priestia megaterium TaxID=1404 RepID=UPI000BF607E6|nr:hypothetical protein [Priestia megaterium]PFJ40193.1 hypothetical protein COJ00_27065 [Priestia megaterium]